MRVPRSKVWRAFPELDAFDDERCARFVAAVRRGFRAGLVRRGLAVAALVAIYAGVLFVLGLLKLLNVRNPPLLLQIAGVVGIFAFFILPVVPALMVRDWVLRRQIRRLLRTRGSCGRCGYGLAGLPVGTNLTVACPECGHATAVDAAMGELAPDGRGGSAFAPRAGGMESGVRLRRWDYARSLLKPVALIVALGAALWCGGTLWRWYRVGFGAWMQRQTGADWYATARAVRPPLGEPTGPDIWPRVAEVHREFRSLQGQMEQAVWQKRVAVGPPPEADFTGLVRLRGRRAVLAVPDGEVRIALAREVVKQLRSRPLVRDLAALAGCRIEQRAHPAVPWGGAAVVVPDPPVQELLAPVLGWAMLAAQDDQVDEFRDALAAAVAIMGAAQRDAPQYGFGRGANGADVLEVVREALRRHRSVEWLDAAAEALERWPRPDLAGELLLAQIAECDTLVEYFDHGVMLENYLTNLQASAKASGGAPPAVKIGTLNENLAALRAWYAGMVAWAKLPFAARAATVPPARPTGLVALQLTGWRSAGPWDRLLDDCLQRDGLMNVMAVERFRIGHGRLPVDMAEAGADWGRALPRDPYTDNPFCLRVAGPGGSAYVVYAIGPGGKDYGGAGTVNPADGDTGKAVGVFQFNVPIRGLGE